MRFEQFSSSRVIIVAGKGGVGKTTVTASLAVAAARAGSSVLIVEVEGKSGLAAAFGRPPLDYREVELESSIHARTLTPDEALVEYLEGRGMRRLTRRMARSGVVDVIATAVPGMKDILVLGKVKQLEVASDASDLIIIDAPAAGHAISFLMSPHGLLDTVRVGPISHQAAAVVEMLADPSRCQVMLTTVPEETPVNELIDTAYALEDRVGVALAPVVVNACYEALPFDQPATAESIRTDAEALGESLTASDVDELLAAARFREGRVGIQQHQAARLAQALPLPQIRLPFLFRGDLGRDDIDVLADAFAAGVDALPEDMRW